MCDIICIFHWSFTVFRINKFRDITFFMCKVNAVVSLNEIFSCVKIGFFVLSYTYNLMPFCALCRIPKQTVYTELNLNTVM